MLKMKMPEASVRNRMRQDGFTGDSGERLFDLYVLGKTADIGGSTLPVAEKPKLPPPPKGKVFQNTLHHLLHASTSFTSNQEASFCYLISLDLWSDIKI